MASTDEDDILKLKKDYAKMQVELADCLFNRNSMWEYFDRLFYLR